jgi:asparagine synthetase B (glutamine-hydrolysing)
MKLLKIKSASLLINESTIPPNIEYILELDQRILLAENYNYKADKSTSAASLEERVPLQEYHLVEYLNSLPMSDKISLREGKKPLLS